MPPNCEFEIDDFEQEWLFRTKFDYIHGRELEGAVADEAKVFKQAYDHLKPGGYFEFDGGYGYFKSDDGTHEKAENANRWGKEGREAAEKFGKSFENVLKWKKMMENTGFVDVKEKIFKV
jgi:SAM-dependent methyltransferase